MNDNLQNFEEIIILSALNLIKGIGWDELDIFENIIISEFKDISSSLQNIIKSLNNKLNKDFGLDIFFHIFSKLDLITTELKIFKPLIIEVK